MILSAAAASARDLLVGAGFAPNDAWRDAVVIARSVLGRDEAEWLVRSRDAAPPGFVEAYLRLIERRAAREPVAYITGRREFYGRTFRVTPDVLIPRPETELIIEEALRSVAGRASNDAPRIIDVGTGSGCLAITLALELPSAEVIATDVSDSALQVAQENAARLGAERVMFMSGSCLAAAHGPFDLIVSNPPYIAAGDRPSLPRDVADYEPAAALFAGADGLAVIRDVVTAAATALAPAGWLIMEIGQGQSDRVRQLVTDSTGLALEAVRDDLQGIPRVVVARRNV
jgi:release factor glutamine methyltransferase